MTFASVSGLLGPAGPLVREEDQEDQANGVKLHGCAGQSRRHFPAWWVRWNCSGRLGRPVPTLEQPNLLAPGHCWSTSQRR